MPAAAGTCQLFGERLDSVGFVFLHVEHRVQLGDLQQVVHLLGEMQQLEFATLALHGGKRADQFANARTVDIADVAQVQQDMLGTLAENVLDGVAQYHAAFAQSNSPAQVNDGYAIHLPGACFHAHVEASWRSSSVPGIHLIKVISVPGSSLRNRTSSINARIRNIPRPDCFIRFSGARGSGTSSGSRPLPSSPMVIINSRPFCSNDKFTRLSGSYALPCKTALIMASRTAMVSPPRTSSSKPA